MSEKKESEKEWENEEWDDMCVFPRERERVRYQYLVQHTAV